MSAEPGEDTCLRCNHPDHSGAVCGALMGTFHGDDGATDDDLCDCTGYATGGYVGTTAPHPAFETTHWYDIGGVIPPGLTLVYNDSGEDEEVRPS
jgi:hypothetical protein